MFFCKINYSQLPAEVLTICKLQKNITIMKKKKKMAYLGFDQHEVSTHSACELHVNGLPAPIYMWAPLCSVLST